MAIRIYLNHPPTCLDRDIRHPDRLPFCVTPSLITRFDWYGNINPFPIGYAFQPRLRGRLTLRGLPFLRKPWIFGEQVSHLFYRYSCRHTHFHTVHPSLQSSFNPYGTLPYQRRRSKSSPIHSFGDRLEPRYIFGAGTLDQ